MQELRRQAGWAKTFGLPLELDLRRGGAGALPADVARTASSARPTSRRTAISTPASSPSLSRREPGARGAEIDTNTRVTGIARRARPGRRRRDGQGLRSRREVVVNAGGMFARRDRAAGGRQRADRPDGARVSGHAAERARRSTCPTMRDPRSWSTSAASRAGSSWAATSATRRHGGWTGSRRTSTASSCRRTGSASTSS